MKTLFSTLLSFLIFNSNAYAELVSSFDDTNKCVIYRTTTEKNPILSTEKILSPKGVYGFSLKNADIDFENKSVHVDIWVRIIMGLNYNLTSKPVEIKSSNPNFNFLINQLNRAIFLFEKVCVSEKNELIWATFFEPEKIKEESN